MEKWDLYLRDVNYQDCDLLFDWANDIITRKNSFHEGIIPYEQHVDWFEHMMQDNTIIQFVLMNEKKPVGQIRLNVDFECAVVSYSISPDMRGQGYGQIIILMMINKIRAEHSEIKKLKAYVKKDNVASVRCLTNSNFVWNRDCFEYVL